jgi:hypothetical protein
MGDGASESGQKGFFDVERRLETISAKGDPLETIKKIVPWGGFLAAARNIALGLEMLAEALEQPGPRQRSRNSQIVVASGTGPRVPDRESA